MRTYWVETYGCQMNKAESEALIRDLEEAGWGRASAPEEADVVVLNTCTVRQTAEERIAGRLGYYRYLKKHGRFILVLMGCMAERMKEEVLEAFPHVDVVVGTFQKNSFVRLLRERAEDLTLLQQLLLTEEDEYSFEKLHHSGLGFKAFVPIMHGCNNFCSYCIVPYVRGREISRRPSEIFEEIEALLEKGVREITLLGQNVNSYRFTWEGKEMRFAGLLREIVHRFPELPWLRFLTSHPKDLSEELIEVMSASSSICKHLHLPVQHGSNRILGAMNRRYTREHYLNLVERIRTAMPGIALTTDILVGFPGETEEDLELTLDLMRRVRFADAYTYYYNPRKGTRAYEWGDPIPLEVKKERLGRVIRLQRELSLEWKQRKIGRMVDVLVEEVSRKREDEVLARTEQDEMVVFPAPPERIGRFAHVQLVSLEGNTFRAKEVIRCLGDSSSR
ncbi:(Dimethylallyl)adenosine tRNA methylthiotransferase miaB [Spirochaeta thermophila DSM 6578]|uniref:tRNA-2-methylthio-N(6)-dimethylallyladenosine synthase n=1 Tax=Winmispira thermophila (strain ATCC 700085 / DSM 6578 / Z-1203) TaxID=869211 RepID=G0GD01_WINT7|nr:tRNA (N6-isopentenyl adenosine(37)-C2)-methylthiotransferase MiaB [Spirochaeta thermophila]AEJ61293.1 (Dimethylallyl)adenosine tRNA methylthiotransferase miaB [Spirochaeta thermophila DSM 6578]